MGIKMLGFVVLSKISNFGRQDESDLDKLPQVTTKGS